LESSFLNNLQNGSRAETINPLKLVIGTVRVAEP
jgi:hypothetical protein